jgi:hypothetical protein
MMVIEAASDLGTIQHEPSSSGGAPDIHLRPLGGRRPLWIEAVYPDPPGWEELRRWDDVCSWLWAEARRQGIPIYKIEPRLDGGRGNKASALPKLPLQHERKEFLRRPEVVEFFEAIRANPDRFRCYTVSGFDITICYSPDAGGPFESSRRPAFDDPKTIDGHHVYKVLKRKAEQHEVAGPRVVCLGSDQIPSLLSRRSPGGPALSDAIEAVFAKHASLSAVIVFCADNIDRPGKGLVFRNPNAREPLMEEEVALLCTMNLNRWRRTFPLAKWEEPRHEGRCRVTGTITWQFGDRYVKIEIPANIVVEALAGKTSVAKELRLPQDDQFSRVFADAWVIEECSLKEGNIELGEAPKVVLRLVPPPPSVFWPDRKL